MAFSQAQTTALQRADRAAIKRCMSRIEQYWADSRWLATRNRYRSDCVTQIDRDAPSAQVWTPTHVHLSDYIAASAVTHGFDGWAYLGRALDAELSGDPDSARHLGYYAELRAAMALLAADGIGVFNKKHVVVDSQGKCHIVRADGTHVFTWEVLQFWAASSAGVDTLLNSIQPGGVRLRQWLNHYPASVNFIATSWLKQWGLDLSQLADDRQARNLASYRPTAYTSPGPTGVVDTIDAVARFWEMCEPGALGGFPVLDRHLLRRGVELAFATSRGRTRRQARKRFENTIKEMLHGVAPTGLSADQWEQFLNYEDGDSDSPLLEDASGHSNPAQPRHSKEVLARAALLLRVATGSVAELLSDVTKTGGSELEFWWSDRAVRRRLWPDGSPPNAFADLWLDVRDAAEAVTTWAKGNASRCHYGLWNSHGREAGALATTERVALWGLGL